MDGLSLVAFLFIRSSELPSDDIDETAPVSSSIPISSFLVSLVRRCLWDFDLSDGVYY